MPAHAPNQPDGPGPALLVLEDGRTFHGEAYGAEGETFGEAVFNTGMTGYQETLTDPSYHRQVVVMTAPHIGNTGVNDEDAESSRIWVAGYVVRDPARRASNWRSQRSLDDELRAQGVVGISGIDTRALTRHLRERGAMRVGISSTETDAGALLQRVHGVRRDGRRRAGVRGLDQGDVRRPGAWGEKRFTVAALDLGIKGMTPHRMAERGIEVHVLPATASLDEIKAVAPGRAVLLERPRRPGRDHAPDRRAPGRAGRRDPVLRHLLRQPALRPGARLRHLQAQVRPPRHQPAGDGPHHRQGRGHRPQPRVRRRRATRRQHHHAVRRGDVSHVCLNDDVVEGLELRDADGKLTGFSVQYHPEAAAGPHDAAYLFDRFVELMESRYAGSSLTTRLLDHRKRGSLMPKRDDIKSVMVIGSGPIIIGQACEFDYSGTQACRVLKAEGIRVILVNSNPATIMTDPEFADATYVEPITPDFVEKVIAKERPDALLPTLGGQTALNAAIALHENGVLEKYGVEMIGASFEAIHRGENREMFNAIVEKVGGETARSFVCHTLDDCEKAVAELGYPVVVRPSFTMGGTGSGIAYDETDLTRIAGAGLAASPTTEVLIEESIIGWKEYELEVMRDKADNVVIICSIENLDPMGVHTGDSITVAPAMTLTDREYQHLRDLAIGIIREVGVDTGGCNIQYAVNPADGRVIVIEMNPRVSRSSARSPRKATGFPIAKIAAKVAIGYTLDEIPNDITMRADGSSTPAAFEPTLDYVVVKVPRFAFEKFPGADPTLTTHMKSVGEAMAIGRNFTEALQKALRSLESKDAAFDWHQEWVDLDKAALLAEIEVPHDGRLKKVMDALRAGATAEEIFDHTKIDPWFVDQLLLINEIAEEVTAAPELTPGLLRKAKRHGFSDVQIGKIRGMTPDVVRGVRHALGIRPVYKTVDTCAAEFAAATPYHYSSYDEETEVAPREKQAVIILGSGPNRIGQGIEFDYSCVHASLTLSEAGYETIMVNCNPETVSTDYDTSDRLYFEPLTLEDVLEIVHAEEQAGPVVGVICQLGGQTPLGLAQGLKDNGVTDPRHLARGDPPRRGARRLRRGARRRRAAGAEVRHGDQLPRRTPDRGRDRLPGDGAAVVRPRRPRHGDRVRRRRARGLHRAVDRDRPGAPGAGRPVHRRRGRDRRGRAVRRRGALPRRRDGAHRGGRHPLRRLVVRAAADHARQGRDRPDPRGDRGDRARRRRARAAQHPVRARLRRALRPGGQPAGQPDRAVRVEGDRHAAGEGRRPGDARGVDRRAAGQRAAAGHRRRRHAAGRPADRGQGGGDAVQPVPHPGRQAGRHGARPGDEVHRRGDGPRRRLRHRVRQGPGRRVRPAADQRQGLREHGQPRQAAHDLPDQGARRARLRDPRDPGHRGGAAPQRRGRPRSCASTTRAPGRRGSRPRSS